MISLVSNLENRHTALMRKKTEDKWGGEGWLRGYLSPPHPKPQTEPEEQKQSKTVKINYTQLKNRVACHTAATVF